MNQSCTAVFRVSALRQWAMRGVKWSAGRRRWEYAPAIVSPYLFDPEYQERAEQIDRPTAASAVAVIATRNQNCALMSASGSRCMCCIPGLDSGPLHATAQADLSERRSDNGHVDEAGQVELGRDRDGVRRAVSVLGDDEVGLAGAR